MRVIHVSNSSEEFMFGVDRYIEYLSAAEKTRGMSVSVVVDRQGPMVGACHEHGIPVSIIESLRPRAGMRMPEEKVIHDLIEQFRSLDGELINCHTLPAASPTIRAASRIHIPCLLTLHFNGDMGRGGGAALIATKRSGLRFAMISVSKPRFEQLKGLGIPQTELYYVPLGTEAVSPTSLREPRQPARPNLILVGTLAARKGVDIAILATAELRRRRAGGCPALNIYGQGADENYLKEMVTSIGMDDSIRFHGHVHNILASCDDSDILLVPSREEQGPKVVLEAMSRGMPVVSSDVGDVREMLPDRRYGYIARVGSIIEFADATESLLSDIDGGRFDPDLLRERHREHYTTEKMAERIEAVYEDFLKSSHTA
jgi:glycosyltransferase involved in cell wall biosynthesis